MSDQLLAFKGSSSALDGLPDSPKRTPRIPARHHDLVIGSSHLVLQFVPAKGRGESLPVVVPVLTWSSGLASHTSPPRL